MELPIEMVTETEPALALVLIDMSAVAEARGHGQRDVVDLMLSLIYRQQNRAGAFLLEQNLTYEVLLEQTQVNDGINPSNDRPQTESVQAILDAAKTVAGSLFSSTLRTEHVLLALLDTDNPNTGPIAELLQRNQIDMPTLHAKLSDTLCLDEICDAHAAFCRAGAHLGQAISLTGTRDARRTDRLSVLMSVLGQLLTTLEVDRDALQP